MKKLIPILIALIAFTATAQDGLNQSPAFYNALQEKTINISQDHANSLSEDFTSNLEQTFNFVTNIQKEKGVTLIYQLDGERLKYSSTIDESNLVIWFSKTENEKFTVQKVQGPKQALQELWRENFLPTASLDNIANKYPYRIVAAKKLNLHFQLVERGGYWVIENRSK